MDKLMGTVNKINEDFYENMLTMNELYTRIDIYRIYLRFYLSKFLVLLKLGCVNENISYINV